ncbi:hypothetical protein AXF42_Ash016149 [Apostasia shenzhenica]|uniref:LysM domain-containing protein n=1 Tax=Apostasia shenzhenica TaxID=1088818 RepID=A0A2I0AEK0_9ASPA|nr:hypothetical protein AXF42_Ash016149 [Apostasia shenzhenica]
MASTPRRKLVSPAAMAACEAASRHLALGLVALVLVCAVRENYAPPVTEAAQQLVLRRRMLSLRRPCDEIYVVGEGETLHTISDKCGDPFIVERNPHVHDPDDVYPGLVLMITPSSLKT